MSKLLIVSSQALKMLDKTSILVGFCILLLLPENYYLFPKHELHSDINVPLKTIMFGDISLNRS